MFSIIDFALVTKIFHANGTHKEQKQLKSFYGNSLFASDAMINLQSTSRKDDLESLMYILCFLYRGTIPVVDYVNKCLEVDDNNSILERIQNYRKDNQSLIHSQVKEMLPGSMKTAFTYITQLAHAEKPNYNLIKLFLT